ncbi:hypothetical protein O1611_g77 [Lasiodiplodia mahajangana]|uniref:Uncharacterized protein n=1 Tax=Lasiodiplodia mahajangana TaxID=1108764 RepID=A0ACC2K1I5_9PEZI|nr:hypothetical protein O1611_g77 [Lasiodiplodia mahajangana]
MDYDQNPLTKKRALPSITLDQAYVVNDTRKHSRNGSSIVFGGISLSLTLVADTERFKKQLAIFVECLWLLGSVRKKEQRLDDDGNCDESDEIRATSFLFRNTNHEIQTHVGNKGCAVILQDENDSAVFAPKEVPSSFDFFTAREWLGYCNKNHKLLCHLESTPVLGYGFQVIDCDTPSIEETSGVIPYVALRYVWRDAHASYQKLRNINGRKKLPEQLSVVIQDLITVTRALGYQMDLIYRNSALTIIAAAGTGENYGLPGVGFKPRSPQLTANVQAMKVVRTKDPQQVITSSHRSSCG